jgi:hypothetical protein
MTVSDIVVEIGIHCEGYVDVEWQIGFGQTDRKVEGGRRKEECGHTHQVTPARCLGLITVDL